MNRTVKSALIAGLSALTIGIGTARADVVHQTAPVARPVSGVTQAYQQGAYGQPQRGYEQPQQHAGYGEPQRGYEQPQRGYEQPQQAGYGEPERAGHDRDRDHDQDRNAWNTQTPSWNTQNAAWNTPVFVSWTPESYRRAERELDRQQDLFFSRRVSHEAREQFEHRMAERRAELRRRYEQECREHGQRAVYYRG